MPKAAVVYFSQNGTTAQVAQAIAAGVSSAGFVVDLWNLRDGPPPEIGGYDLLGIGSPVYYYRVPFNVADYLDALPGLAAMPVFFFLVHGSHAFDAANSLHQAIIERGAKHVGYFHCFGAAYFLGHLREGYLFSPEHPSASELERATAFGVASGQRAAKGELALWEEEPRPPLMYRIERALESRWMTEQVYSRLFKVDRSRCTACGLCMEVCPTKNIAQTESGHPLWGRRCLYCLSCEMKCPEDAITSVISRPFLRSLGRPFLRYNVRRWSRETGLECVRVVHRHGRTERLPTDRRTPS